MGSFAVGDVVLLPFPYSDFSETKLRPAIVVAIAEFDNLIVCQVTSKSATSNNALRITDDNFSSGSLQVTSYARPDKLFTIDAKLVRRNIARLTPNHLKKLQSRIKTLFE